MNQKLKFEQNWPLLGNEQVSSYLAKSLNNGKIASMYIFVGPDDVGKTTIANYFTAALMCEGLAKGGKLPCGECAGCRQNQVAKTGGLASDFSSIHPDYHLLKRASDKKHIEVEEVREFIHDMEMSSFMNSYKVGVVKQADSLNDFGFNALLKTLEEPKQRVVFILIAKSLESLPKTVISRAQVIRFYSVKSDIIYNYLVDEQKIARSQAKMYARLSMGRPALALKFCEDHDFFESYVARVNGLVDIFDRDINGRLALVEELLKDKIYGQEANRLAQRIIEAWQGVVRDLLLIGYGHPDLVQHENILDRLDILATKVPRNRLLQFFQRLTESLTYLRANVNSKIVLENLVINF